MGKDNPVSGGQSRSLIGSFSVDTPWDEIKNDLQSFIELPPIERGKRFAAFLRNDCRLMIGDPKSIPTKPFDPAKFIGKDWETWKGSIDGNGLSGEKDVDPRGLALTEIEVSRLIFETCLKKDEKTIKGEEKLRRQKEMPVIRLGGNIFFGLWEDYQANKENSVLEYLYRTQKITFLDFMGQVLRDPDGDRCVLCLYRRDVGKWDWLFHWLDRGWIADDPSACAQV